MKNNKKQPGILNPFNGVNHSASAINTPLELAFAKAYLSPKEGFRYLSYTAARRSSDIGGTFWWKTHGKPLVLRKRHALAFANPFKAIYFGVTLLKQSVFAMVEKFSTKSNGDTKLGGKIAKGIVGAIMYPVEMVSLALARPKYFYKKAAGKVFNILPKRDPISDFKRHKLVKAARHHRISRKVKAIFAKIFGRSKPVVSSTNRVNMVLGAKGTKFYTADDNSKLADNYQGYAYVLKRPKSEVVKQVPELNKKHAAVAA